MKVSQVISFLFASLKGAAYAQEIAIPSIHGSGTTNPSKCIWHIMSLFEERSRVATRLTYRAVGSSTGQAEFLGANNIEAIEDVDHHVPHNDFGAGDIPIKKDDYNHLRDNGNSGVAHLPFAMSSVSWFHNIPNVPDGEGGIKLDACLLARIFSGKISSWDSPEILEENGHLKDVLKGDIYVSRRVKGSSSTKSITQYMNSKCPQHWSTVGSTIDWAVGTHGCEGSGGMTDCIRNNAGSIGYIDSGHGWAERLKEVNVKNEDNFYLTSKMSHERGGIAQAATAGNPPTKVTADWSEVNFLNKSGRDVWPIVLMSYVYVRTDINKFIKSDEERGLLKLFLEAMYDDDYFGACKTLGFSAPPKTVTDMAKEGIKSDIVWDFFENENMWTFEKDTKPLIGQGKYVISAKRRSLAGISIEDIGGAEKKLREDVEYLLQEFHEMAGSNEGGFSDLMEEIDRQKKNTEAALILAALSWSLWMCTIVAFVLLKCVRRK